MSNYPDFDQYGYQVIQELGRNREAGRITYLATALNPDQIKQVRDTNSLIMSTQVWMPLRYIPVDPNYPPALVQLGMISNQHLEIGQDIELRNPVSPFTGTYFFIKITGFRYDFALALPPDGSVTTQAEDYFFSKYPKQAYRRLTTEEYYKLYPEEHDLIPGRVINFEEF